MPVLERFPKYEHSTNLRTVFPQFHRLFDLGVLCGLKWANIELYAEYKQRTPLVYSKRWSDVFLARRVHNSNGLELFSFAISSKRIKPQDCFKFNTIGSQYKFKEHIHIQSAGPTRPSLLCFSLLCNGPRDFHVILKLTKYRQFTSIYIYWMHTGILLNSNQTCD